MNHNSGSPEAFTSDEIIAIVREATDSVFSTMLALPAQPLPARHESGDPAPVDGVVALVGIAGAWTGTGRIHCSPGFACKLAGAMFCSDYSSVNEDVLDSVAEVSNMIIGNLKTALETRLGPLGLGVPTVIFGRNYQARTSMIHEWIVVPFQSDQEVMEVRFSLVRTQQSVRHHPASQRPEPSVA